MVTSARQSGRQRRPALQTQLLGVLQLERIEQGAIPVERVDTQLCIHVLSLAS